MDLTMVKDSITVEYLQALQRASVALGDEEDVEEFILSEQQVENLLHHPATSTYFNLRFGDGFRKPAEGWTPTLQQIEQLLRANTIIITETLG